MKQIDALFCLKDLEFKLLFFSGFCRLYNNTSGYRKLVRQFERVAAKCLSTKNASEIAWWNILPVDLKDSPVAKEIAPPVV